MYLVEVTYTDASAPSEFGPFTTATHAELCLLTLCRRDTIRVIKIKPLTPEPEVIPPEYIQTP